ncbi:MAG: UDP-N-acetylglucosamine 2-epimerase (non-hydrolyzing) [Elusimicrobiota bacterium]
MKKIFVIFGTRPEAVKLIPLVKELNKYRGRYKTVVCITGQHREMLDQVMKLFNQRADYDLDIMQINQTLYDITTHALTKIGDVIKKVKPDMVVVQGDTTTAFAGALSGFYEKVPVAHVEAGLRTGDIYNPFPEEVNRLMIDRIASLYLVPTGNAKAALLREGVGKEKIFVTGNTVVDALMWVAKKSETKLLFPKEDKLILLTSHRRENLGKPLENICRAVKMVVKKYKDVKVVYPVHLNPAVQKTVYSILGSNSRVVLTKPVGYSELVNLIKMSYLILTDSGGIQEEAPALGKPVLVLRKTTERPEGVTAGTAKLVGTDTADIVRETSRLIDDKKVYNRMAQAVNPYGDGHACERTVAVFNNFFGYTSKRPSEF